MKTTLVEDDDHGMRHKGGRSSHQRNYETSSGRGAAEGAEYDSALDGGPTDRHRREHHGRGRREVRGRQADRLPGERKLQNNFSTGAVDVGEAVEIAEY